tara:strand:+ start:2864 stop:3592 length:729 start_codon:yes stop_codon:yes gene_type:complete
MSNYNNAGVEENQLAGNSNTNVGQDDGVNTQENSSTDWESQAKYFQSEKDKLFEDNKRLKKYEEIGKFLESRPDVVETIKQQSNGQPKTQDKIQLKPDEFDPWEAYNDPSSKSYQYRQQEMQDAINGAVENAVGGVKKDMGRNKLVNELQAKGLNQEQVDSFLEFTSKNPAEYGLDTVLTMWQAATNNNNNAQPNANPREMVKQAPNNLQAGGVLTGQQPARKNDSDKMWEGIMSSGDRGKF